MFKWPFLLLLITTACGSDPASKGPPPAGSIGGNMNPPAGSGGRGGAGGAGGGGNVPGTGGATSDAAAQEVRMDGPRDATGETQPVQDARADGATDVHADRPPLVEDAGAAATLDSCFQGLRAPTVKSADQIGNRQSADGRYRTRLALEYKVGFAGTSGTTPLLAYRFALETPDGVVCVDQEAALKDAYKTTHHNCDDSFDLTFKGRRYLIKNPGIDPMLPPAQLTIFEGTNAVVGPLTLVAGVCTTSETRGCSVNGGCQ